jgi:hypothetical protein
MLQTHLFFSSWYSTDIHSCSVKGLHLTPLLEMFTCDGSFSPSASPVTWRCMVGWVIPDVSKHCSTFQTLVTTHPVKQSHIPEEMKLQQHCYENFKSCNSKEICAHANSSKKIWNGASTVPWPEQSQFWDQPDPLCIFLYVTSVWFMSGKQNFMWQTMIPCVLQPKLSAGSLLVTHLAKPLFRMIYLDEVKQWKVRSFVKPFTILMYS